MLAATLLFACGDDTEPEGGGGSGGAPQGGSTTGGASQGGMGGMGGTGDGGAGAGPDCETPSSAEIGPEGGTLEHCGAKLVIPPGALADTQSFQIGIDPAPPQAPFHYELASPVFNIRPQNPGLQQPASLTIAHEAADSRFELVRYDERFGGFAPIEACEVTATSIQQFVGVLGTWAVLADTLDYPDSTTGLGDGTLDLDFQGDQVTYDLDAANSYGIYQANEDGSKTVTLLAIREVKGGLERLRIDLSTLALGGGALVQVDWLSTVTGTGYSYIQGLIGSAGEISVEETEGRLLGSLSANVQGGDPPGEVPLSLSFDVAVELFAFPPELSCPSGPEG